MRCNRKKLAELLGRDVKTIDKMVGEGMPFVRRPEDAQGSRSWEFDTVAVLGWMRGDTPGLDEKLRAARTRIVVAQAELRTLEYLEKLGILQNLDDFMPLFEEALINVRANLYNIPGRVSQLIAYESDEDKIVALLQHEAEEALRPFLDLAAETAERGARSRKLLDDLARDPVYAKLVRGRRRQVGG
jgi:phage terminase Nu1 subunit (DNA packaging protein)